MEMCMPRLLSHAPLPLRRPPPSHPFASSSPPLPASPLSRYRARTTLSLFPKSVEQHKNGTFAVRSSTSEDISASISGQLDEQSGKVVITNETEAAEEVDESPKKYETPVPAVEVTPPEEEPTESQFQPFQFFDDFNLEGRRLKEFRRGEGLLPVRASWKASCVLETRAAQFHNFCFNHLASSTCGETAKDGHQLRFSNFNVRRRDAVTSILLGSIFFIEWTSEATLAQPAVVFREYVDAFDGYSFKYPKNWIQVRGAGADIFYRDPFVLDENLSVELSSPSSSRYKSVEDLGSPQEAGNKVLKQYLTEFMSTRLGVRRESSILSTTSRVADDGRLYYQVEANIKSYANNNELAVMPEDRVVRLEWDRRYLSVLGVENNRLYELRLQTPEKVFKEEEDDLRQVMDSFRVTMVVN